MVPPRGNHDRPASAASPALSAGAPQPSALPHGAGAPMSGLPGAALSEASTRGAAGAARSGRQASGLLRCAPSRGGGFSLQASLWMEWHWLSSVLSMARILRHVRVGSCSSSIGVQSSSSVEHSSGIAAGCRRSSSSSARLWGSTDGTSVAESWTPLEGPAVSVLNAHPASACVRLSSGADAARP